MASDKDIENMIINVANSSDGLDFIYFLLEEFGTFTTKIQFSDGKLQNIEKVIKREQGEFILELIRQNNFKKYTEIQERRSNDKWQQKTMS